MARTRILVPDHEFTKRRVPQHVSKREKRLFKDFLSVGDKQKPPPSPFFTQPLVIEGGHDCLAGSSGSDQKVAMAIVSAPLRIKLLKDLGLVWPRHNVKEHPR